MWAEVQTTSANATASAGRGSPFARCKHAMCVTPDGHIYLYGGRSANIPLKDLWRFDAGQSQWEEVRGRGQHPPHLQEHSIESWNNKLYVFGGEIGFSSSGETPLWTLELSSCVWTKQTCSGAQPSGRRGHSAVLYGEAMHVYGGYQDLRGSSSELWTFDFAREQWHLASGSSISSEHPPPRHTHSAVVHNGSMWIYGGMTDLQDRNDFWRWDFSTRLWHRVKANKGPGELHGHTAIKAYNSMFIFGGERGGNLLHELWRFNFGAETWERVIAEGVIPNSRCRHVALANPFLNCTTDVEESNKILRVSSKSNCISSSQNNSKALLPPKSISMCFGQPTDTPLHENGKALKHFKFRVHPMSALCSGRSATLSDDDDDIENAMSTVRNENYGNDNVMHYNHRNNQVTMRKSLKDKISQSRLVRSISSNSYNVLTHQNICTAEELKDELERLVEKSKPQASNPCDISPIKADGNYHKLKTRAKMLKSVSSNAVLESDSESSTPQHNCSNRPLSEVIQTQSVVTSPLDDELNNPIWSSKRHTVHESMSYYSLCFPSPLSRSKSGSETSNASIDNNVSNSSMHPNITASDRTFSKFEEELENSNVAIADNCLSPDLIKDNIELTKTLIELSDDNENITIASPEDGRPKSSGNSSLTLFTPSVRDRCISHSVSHSSGYQSFTDDTMYDHKDFAEVLQKTSQSIVIPRRASSRIFKDPFLELKNLNTKISDQNQSGIADNGVPITLRAMKENRSRSWDRTQNRREGSHNRASVTPGFDHLRMAWQPNVNVIKEVVVPGSPASRKWSYSPAKSRLHQHHWQLCMYVFGGREKGVSGIYKQPISIWKLYI